MDDNKNNRIIINSNNSNILDSLFIKDNNFRFIFKKTEKIVTAIYLVSNFLGDNEPLKWSLRKSGNDLIKSLMSFKDNNLIETKTLLLEMETLFNLAYNTGYVSPMNYEILSSEIDKLSAIMGNFNNKTNTPEYDLLNKEDLDVSKEVFDVKDNTKGHISYKRHDNVFNKDNKLNTYSDSHKKEVVKRSLSKKTNNERRENIMAEIKRLGEVSVKDIAKAVTDCSEKTLQRELLSMVDEGIIDKKGERRWSRYSIKKS